MGLFSSKKKHIVDTQISRVVEDNFIPNPVNDALLASIFEGQDYIEATQENAMYGNHRNFQRMYKYAERGDYFFGLPDAKVLSSSDGFDLAIAALKSETDPGITVDYMQFRPLNNVHAGYKHLVDNLGYNPNTNVISGINKGAGIVVYLDKMVAVHASGPGIEPEQSGLGAFDGPTSAGETPDRPAASLGSLAVDQEVRVGSGEIESVEIHITYRNANDVSQFQIHEILDLSGYDTDKEYYQARYTLSGNVGYWTYDPDTGLHPALDAVFDIGGFTNPGTYFPFAVFRSEGTNRTDDSLLETDEFKTTAKLLDYINMDFKSMGDSIHENPDINSIDQAVLMMAVPITSQHEIDMEYLYRYFEDLYSRLPAGAQTNRMTIGSAGSTSGAPSETYAVDISDADFRMTVSFDNITKKTKAGSIGPVGTVTNTLSTISLGSQRAGNWLDGVEALSSREVRVFRRQITNAVYVQYTVENPNVRYQVTDKKKVEGGANDERLMIPLDYNVVKTMPNLKIGELYYRSLHFVFNSHVVQETKWYESGAFKAILVIVAVVITIYSLGQTWQAAVAAAGVGATVTAITLTFLGMVINNLLVGLVVQFVLTEVVEVIGVEAGFWLAVAAAVAAGYQGYQASMMNVTNNAQHLLKAAAGLTQATQTTLAEDFADLQESAEKFGLEVEAKWAELEEANKLLEGGLELDPFTFIGQEPMTIFGETPDNYFHRLSHVGNVGVESLKIVQNFVDISLRLPEIQATIGDL